MLDVPTWVWQVAAAIGGGLGLGVGLGALMQRGKKRGQRVASPTRPSPPGAPRAATSPAPLASGEAAGAPPTPRAPVEREAETPQQRLLERQREQTAQLSGQLRTTAQAHARELGAKTQELQAERLRAQRELEALRQAHAEELSHLMTVLVEQVDKIHQLHARQLRQLEAQVTQARGGHPAELPGGPVDTGPTGAMVAEAARLSRPETVALPPLATVDNPPVQVPAPSQGPAPRRAV